MPSRPSKPGLPGILWNQLIGQKWLTWTLNSLKLNNLPLRASRADWSFSASRSRHANVTAIALRASLARWARWKLKVIIIDSVKNGGSIYLWWHTWAGWTIFFGRTAKSRDGFKLKRVKTTILCIFHHLIVVGVSVLAKSFDISLVLDFVIALRGKQMPDARTDIDTHYFTTHKNLLPRTSLRKLDFFLRNGGATRNRPLFFFVHSEF